MTVDATTVRVDTAAVKVSDSGLILRNNIQAEVLAITWHHEPVTMMQCPRGRSEDEDLVQKLFRLKY